MQHAVEVRRAGKRQSQRSSHQWQLQEAVEVVRTCVENCVSKIYVQDDSSILAQVNISLGGIWRVCGGGGILDMLGLRCSCHPRSESQLDISSADVDVGCQCTNDI